MDARKTTEAPEKDSEDRLSLLASGLEAMHREELHRIQLQHFERIRQIESGRLRAEDELETLADRFAEQDELHRGEVATLNAQLNAVRQEVLESVKRFGEQEKKLSRAEALRDALDRERSALFERLRADELRGAQDRKSLEIDKRALAEKVAGLEQALVGAEQAKQRLELARAESKAQAVALAASCDDLERQRLKLNEQLREEAGRLEQHRLRLGAEIRQLQQQALRLSDEKNFLAAHADQIQRERESYRGAMVAAERQLRAVQARRGRQIGSAVAAGFTSWKGFIKLPSAVWRALGSAGANGRPPADVWLAQIDEIFDNGGVRASEDFVRINAGDPSDLASGLTKLARLTAAKDPAIALRLAIDAAQADPRPFRRKWLAFMYFDAGHIDAAQELLASLPESVEFKASERNKGEFIAGCHRLAHGGLALPAVNPGPDFSPVSGRVLYVAASSLPCHATGYTLRTHALLRALHAEGLDVRCVTRPGYPADRSDSKAADGNAVQTIDGIAYESLPGPHRRKLGLDAYLSESAEIIARKAMAENVEAIHAASNYEAALPALMAARKLGIPFVYEVRGLWEYTSASKKSGWEQSERFALDRQLESFTAANADHVLTLTQALAAELGSRGVQASRIALAPNSIDSSAFTPVPRKAELAQTLRLADGDFVIGYAGAAVSYEGLDDLIEALVLLQDRLPHARLLIVGDGDALPSLRKLAEDRGVVDRVVFCGKVAPDSVRDYYAMMNAIALPRKPVTVCQLVSPLKPLEAMALGIPLVVSDVAALKEMVVDGETALVHLAGNARSLADSIEVLAKDADLQAKLAENGRQHVAANRRWDQVAQTIARIYRELAVSQPVDRAVHSPEKATPDLAPVPVKAGKGGFDDQAKLLLDQKLAQALAVGIDALLSFVSAQCLGMPKRLEAFVQLRAAHACLDAGRQAEAITLGEAALAADRSVTTLRSAARLYLNAAQLDNALALAKELEHELGEVRPNDRKFLDEIIGRAQLAALAALPAGTRKVPLQPRRVLNILAFSLPYTSVGYATRSHGLAVGVKNAGWDIRPYTRPGFPYDFKTELEGQSLPAADDIDGVTYGRIFDFNRKGMSEVEYMLAAVEHYERIITREEPEIVHAASNYVTALPALIAARRLGVPFVYEVRGFWEVTRSSRDDKFEHTAKYRFMQLFEALTATHADRVITITTAMKEELVSRGVPENRVDIAYNSVDPGRFMPRSRSQELALTLGIPADVPVIGYVGSFVDYEGLDDLVTAAAGLKAAGRDFRLLLVGDGAVFDDLTRQVASAGLQDKTIMTGRVPHDLVEDYYSLIDIAPFPRKPWEVCELVSPLKPYEAMALEKAVVVSGTRALKEIVTHDENGLVFAKGDVADLERKLDDLLAGPLFRSRLGADARAWIQRERSWDVAGSVCGKVYAALAAERDESATA
ncbi:D-inositol-3-phosphate glycosyltransferase [Achromobacter animicus]|uniref:glycosyltransferase family 4 protein n=1 Tax=Achromobacter animicus TaxID=1389935 RepID=UPI001466C8D4|nr:glycosyltransferase family 4 protein [Achromobacter animicus]CAB3847075.1 D-inositol-3-phosphate glycosyltransferase [Achromobacter animicus]